MQVREAHKKRMSPTYTVGIDANERSHVCQLFLGKWSVVLSMINSNCGMVGVNMVKQQEQEEWENLIKSSNDFNKRMAGSAFHRYIDSLNKKGII